MTISKSISTSARLLRGHSVKMRDKMQEDIYKPWTDYRNRGPITDWGFNQDEEDIQE